jgi:hypothetical protein
MCVEQQGVRAAAAAHVLVWLQVDGGVTFTEPTAIICGDVEGKSNVSSRLCCSCALLEGAAGNC